MASASAVIRMSLFVFVAFTTWGSLVTVSIANGFCVHEYDPSLGTLPSAQGWTHYSDALPESNYSLVSESLVQGLTAPNENLQFYQSNSCVFDFTSIPVALTANLKIISSTSVLASPRTGWTMQVSDAAGRKVALWVAEDEVFLLGLNTELAGPYPIVTTDGFHVYRLDVNSTGAHLSIDGFPTGLSLTLSQFRTDGEPNVMNIGDRTNRAHSSSQLKKFSLLVDDAVPVENTTWGNIKARYVEE